MILTMIQHGILLEKNLNFFTKATRHSGSKWYIVPPPPIFWKYTAHLLRRTLKINAQRIIDTPPLYFQLAPCIYTVYFQKAYGKYVLRYAVAENPQRIRADRDVRGSAQ